MSRARELAGAGWLLIGFAFLIAAASQLFSARARAEVVDEKGSAVVLRSIEVVQRAASVYSDGRVELAEGYTCEDALRSYAGMQKDENGVWVKAPTWSTGAALYITNGSGT
jgi:hypothetical protein